MLFFTFSVALLALLLFFPISKLVWILSVRRLQSKQQRELSQEEINGQWARARFISLLIVLLFSILFNINSIGFPDYG
jgi:cobalamin synthase